MNHIKQIFLSLLLLMSVGLQSHAIGWPGNFEGVMLQGFYWDSYQTETKWTKLEARADELAPYFKLIWIPNSGRSSGGLGYIPVYWFTNHNSDMGSESQLRSMIATYKAKGTGIIADVVLNHRGGVSNWTDFPTETWRGKTWHIGLDGICSSDEVNHPGNPGGATGAPDEGQDFDGARDLDHTNANVQENCKNYCKCLLEDYGYAGFRLDMVKGYAGYYTKMYNQYAKPTYSVGEYWDGSYEGLAGWIESTGGESAAFDFAFKYAVNEAFASGDMRKLVWYEDGVTPKPAGLIHHWYQQLAVTFLDNHDTYRDDWNSFKGNWAAANAFMICSPGTPCVFLPHWNACGDQIGRMINARNSAGITNTSDVRVLWVSEDCYMAELTGTKGKLAVKIGPAMMSPEGYTNDMIYCLGEDYCIWTTTPKPPTVPDNLYVMGNLPQGSWSTNVGVQLTKSGDKFTAQNVGLEAAGTGEYAYFSFVSKLASTSGDWDTVNSSDRYGAETSDKLITVNNPEKFVVFGGGSTAGSANAWKVAPGTYDITVDFSNMTVTLKKSEVAVNPGISWDSNRCVYIIGTSSSSELPHIANPHNLPLTYNSSNPSVATINNSGAINIVAPGTTTINATFAGNASYLAASSSFLLIVKEGQEEAIKFKIVDNVEDLETGKEYLLMGIEGDNLYLMTDEAHDLGTLGYMHGTSLDISNLADDILTLPEEFEISGVTLDLGTIENTFALKTIEEKYIGCTGAMSTRLKLQSTNKDVCAISIDIDPETKKADLLFAKYPGTSNTNCLMHAPTTSTYGGHFYNFLRGNGNHTMILKKVEGHSTGTMTIDADTESISKPIYYNLQGIRVDNPTKGIYIVVRGNRVSKEIIK